MWCDPLDIGKLLTPLRPDPDALLHALIPYIDNAMLDEIASADASFDRHAHRKALTQIRDSGVVPRCLDWHPGEVVRLMRWAEPDAADSATEQSVRADRMRTFCCTLLVRSDFETQGGVDSDSVIQLIASVVSQLPDLIDPATRSVASAMLQFSDDDFSGHRPFVALGILLLCTAHPQHGTNGALLKQLADWVLAEEARVAGPFGMSEDWLFRAANHCQIRKQWLAVSRGVLYQDSSLPAEALPALNTILGRLKLA